VPLALLLPALAMIAAILLVQAFEFAELFWPGSLRHQAALRPLPAGAPAPFVSIHLACCNEPPAMVIATIDRLLALDWPAFEVLVVDNNTGDPALWEPVQAHVNGHRAAAPRAGQTTSSGPGLCFFHLPSWPGYKAGALNVALAQSDPRAEWVAVVDADYLVKPGWLRALAGYFSDPTVAVVQSPQAHRDWAGSHLRRMMNWEYDGFFRIGMHHRQERDAAIQHGTMTLIRAAALRSVGGWDAGSVCEDTELGLRLLRQGLRVVYVDEVLGTAWCRATLPPISASAGAGRRGQCRSCDGTSQRCSADPACAWRSVTISSPAGCLGWVMPCIWRSASSPSAGRWAC
jgi:cellulose synthase/poly-beta-1,6-N-acetylglucosamine synthase-like glycosyltransferase